MDYILRDFFQRHYLLDKHISYLLAKILQGLDAIQSPGIVHHDLKPDNIMVRQSGQSERQLYTVFVINYGSYRNSLLHMEQQNTKVTAVAL
jgi:serine/threonine protein kinase